MGRDMGRDMAVPAAHLDGVVCVAIAVHLEASGAIAATKTATAAAVRPSRAGVETAGHRDGMASGWEAPGAIYRVGLGRWDR